MVDPLDIAHVIEVVPYDPNWPKAFEEESKRLEAILGKNCVKIYHIGSTSVPGLAAKPIIDIMVVVKDILEVDKAQVQLEQLGYTAKGECGILFRRHFHKGDFLRTHNIHIFEEGSTEIVHHLHFRDYLRDSPQASQEYAQLKLELAKQHPHSIVAYCEGKNDFVRKILEHAPNPKLRLLVALTKSEWELVDHFRKKMPYSKVGHTHILAYLGVTAIGYADIAHYTIDLLAIDPAYEKCREEMCALISRWLSHQKIKP